MFVHKGTDSDLQQVDSCLLLVQHLHPIHALPICLAELLITVEKSVNVAKLEQGIAYPKFTLYNR